LATAGESCPFSPEVVLTPDYPITSFTKLWEFGSDVGFLTAFRLFARFNSKIILQTFREKKKNDFFSPDSFYKDLGNSGRMEESRKQLGRRRGNKPLRGDTFPGSDEVGIKPPIGIPFKPA
jgi:hypothetical protein